MSLLISLIMKYTTGPGMTAAEIKRLEEELAAAAVDRFAAP